MPMEGISLHFDHTTTSGSVYAANAVVGAGVEFNYGSYFSIDVTGRDVTFATSTSGSFNPGGFNGIIITDYTDVLPDFTAISLVVDGAGGAIDPSRYWVEDQEIHLNFESLRLSNLNGITFRVVLGEEPTDIGLSNDAVTEGVSGAIIGDLTTVDADQSAGHVYTVDDARFEVVAGQLKLKDGIALDYDTDPTVPITVTTMDEWGNAFDKTLTITVDEDAPPPPANHRPTILSPRLQDALEGDKVAFTVRARDRDGDPLTYSISGGSDADAFVIDPATGELTFKHMPDFERPGSAAGTNSYLVQVSVSDGELTTARAFEINVNDVDEARVIGSAGDDRFSAGDSPVNFIGLSGLDTVTFSGPSSDYIIERGSHGTLYVTGPNGTDTLESIERLQFKDGTLAFDVDGAAGQAYRLYQAAFDRTPDTAGLSYWIDIMDAGTTLLDVAGGFMGSAEFRSIDCANPTAAEFIAKLYLNVLGREGEAAGLVYWEGQISAGVSMAQVLASIAESEEHKVDVAGAIEDGIWYV